MNIQIDSETIVIAQNGSYGNAYFYVAERLDGHKDKVEIDGKKWGLLGSKPLPKEIADLPLYSDDRRTKVAAFYDRQSQKLDEAVEKAFPSLPFTREGWKRNARLVVFPRPLI